MAQKKYISLARLSNFLDNIKAKYSQIGHKHTVSDLTDYKVDTTLSSTSSNPIANKAVDAEFEAVSQAMGALESAIDGKSDSTHTHDDRYYTETEIDQKLSAVNTSIDNIKSGEIVVKEAEHAGSADSATTANSANHATTAGSADNATHAESADSATNANHATTADSANHATTADSATSATKATQDASGNVITSTYETKTDASAKLDEAKEYTNTKTANLISTSAVDTKISTHNTSTTAHSDIRDLISGLTTRLNTLANSDDTTLDQMSEVVSYIKNNKTLIDGITTSKVNVSDIVNNLTTNMTNKPLSAAQGVAIKNLIDALQTEVDGKASNSHTHNYAGSSSAGGAATSANKVNSSLVVKLNGGTTEGTNQFTFDGSATKSVNVTPSAIGASASGHTHDERYYTESEIDSKLFGKANTSHGNHVPTTQTANNATFLRNDNTWQKVTPANIGAAASSHTHTVANITDLTATSTELNYMDGVTSNVQTQLDGKQATVTGAATTITSSNLTANRALISNDSGKVSVSAVTSTELGYLDGVTSNVQTQLDGKSASSHTHEAEDLGFMRADNVYGAPVFGNNDLNNWTMPGVYNCPSGATNVPSGLSDNYGVVAVFNVHGIANNLMQLFSPWTSDKSKIYMRTKNRTVWNDWKVIATMDEVVPITGGTMTGTLNVPRIYTDSTSAVLGSADYPFNMVFARNTYIHDGTNFTKSYGSFRMVTQGTTSTVGQTRLELGNEYTGSNGNAQGTIRMYGSNTYYHTIQGNPTANRTITLPNKNGTLATIEDVASISTLTTAEYNELEASNSVNANTLYMLTDAEEEEVLTLPPFTAEDEGKILRIVNGVPTWVSLPNAEEASF